MSERNQIIETVIDWEWDDESMSLADFFAHIAANVPLEHMPSARATFQRGYGDDNSQFGVWYTRPETDEELAARLANEAAMKAATLEMEEQHERETLARLKAKYEGKS
jgi:hypothetical protein